MGKVDMTGQRRRGKFVQQAEFRLINHQESSELLLRVNAPPAVRNPNLADTPFSGVGIWKYHWLASMNLSR